MASIPVVVKHQGKKYVVEIDTSSNGETFKYQLFSLTGVEPERQKILVKGGQLKDDADMSKLGLKAKQTIMMMGTPSGDTTNIIEKPKEKVKFLEDMTEAEAAQVEGATPAGLQNLGNTCYMNSTLQVLRSVPELQDELLQYSAASSSASANRLNQFGLGSLGASADLTTSLGELFKQMSETQQGFPPLMFLNALRTAFPQFAQKSKDGHGYAQQDAEEAWSQIVSQLRQKLKIKDTSKESEEDNAKDTSFIDKFMAGRFESVMECDEPAAKEGGEEPICSEDTFFKLDCHINAETNHLRDGLMAGLQEQIEKKSDVLGRDAVYTKTSRIARLPKYLPVHFMRFDWRKTTGKKAKIMRKVTFPLELDAVEYCTDDLKKALIPIRDQIRDIRKAEEDVERARKRQKRMRQAEADENAVRGDEPLQKKAEKKKATDKSGDTEMEDVEFKTDAQIEEERAETIRAAKQELFALVTPELSSDEGANHTGLYELRGVITHQGISADSGHYTSFVKKLGPKDPVTGKRKEEDGKWWWFNDDKVSEVESERIETLYGGGQSHSALLLLYRAVPLSSLGKDEKKA